jgi:hypothetical protein
VKIQGQQSILIVAHLLRARLGMAVEATNISLVPITLDETPSAKGLLGVVDLRVFALRSDLRGAMRCAAHLACMTATGMLERPSAAFEGSAVCAPAEWHSWPTAHCWRGAARIQLGSLHALHALQARTVRAEDRCLVQ